MSQYIEFYVKSKNNDFTCIESFSRNSSVYNLCSGPYGKITKMSVAEFKACEDKGRSRQKQIEKACTRIHDQIIAIGSYNDPIDEKLEKIHELYEVLDEYNQEYDNIDFAIKFFEVMGDMVSIMTFDREDVGIYMGVEVGEPTMNDVI